MPDTLQVDSVSVRFGQATALSDVSAYFSSGVTGLLGHNGAGKSTLMNVIAGVLNPDSGRVLLDGTDVGAGKAGWSMLRQQLGLLPQRAGYFKSFTAREFIEYAAWLHRIPRDRVSICVDQALELVQLQDRGSTKMKELSGGMAQRVGIAAAVVHQPRVLILDEPTNGLDIEQREAFRGIIRSLGASTITVLSSHLAEDIAAVCDRAVVLQQGRVAAQGSLYELVHPTASPRGHLETTHVTGPQLEQAYLHILGAR